MRVSDYIAEHLAEREISHVFGVSGANIEDLFDSILKTKKTEVVLAKSEYSASTMCIGSYLSTKRPSVVLTTSGPGILNTVPILAEAYTSKIPMILISGMVSLSMEGVGAFQDTSGKGESFDVLKMLTHCSCYQKKIENENEVPEVLNKAFEYSMKYRRPSIILIPKNFFGKEVSEINLNSISKETEMSSSVHESLKFCEGFLKQENNPPLIVLGEELVHLNNLTCVLDFIKKSGGNIALTANSKGIFDNSSPRFLGLIGVMGHDKVNDYLKLTNHVIFLGVNFSHLNLYGLTPYLSSKEILIINEEKSLVNPKFEKSKVCEVYGDISEIISNLTLRFLNSKVPLIIHSEANIEPSSYNLKNIINEIQSNLPDDANVFIDAGNTGAFVIHHLKLKGNGVCYVSLGMGGMGNSIGAGIGSAVAKRKNTYVFLGDGSFLMYGLEIHTAHEHNLPITFFILNNNSHGMCSTRENVFLTGETGINNFKESYFANGIGKIFPGIITHEVSNMDELKMSLNDIKLKTTTNVISIKISNDENPPFRTFVKN